MATRKKSNMKGMTIKGWNKRPTKKGAGLTKKGVEKKAEPPTEKKKQVK